MTTSERLHRRRCIGLRLAAFFAVLLAAFNWPDWPIIGVAIAGGLFALVVYWRDCRGSASQPTRTETHTRDFDR